MIDLGVVDFVLDVQKLPRREFEQYGTTLFDAWDRFLAMELKLPDFSVGLELEEGSIKGRGVVRTVGTALFVGITGYGGLVQGIQMINATIRTSGKVLVDSAAEPFHIPEAIRRFRRGPGFPGRLERLFARVKKGELTPEEATQIALSMLEGEPDIPPELIESVKRSIASVHRNPQQLSLPLELQDDSESPYAPDPRGPSRERSHPPLPPIERLRLEIWKESKSGVRRVTVIED
jgi:hypothetical protein